MVIYDFDHKPVSLKHANRNIHWKGNTHTFTMQDSNSTTYSFRNNLELSLATQSVCFQKPFKSFLPPQVFQLQSSHRSSFFNLPSESVLCSLHTRNLSGFSQPACTSWSMLDTRHRQHCQSGRSQPPCSACLRDGFLLVYRCKSYTSPYCFLQWQLQIWLTYPCHK